MQILMAVDVVEYQVNLVGRVKFARITYMEEWKTLVTKMWFDELHCGEALKNLERKHLPVKLYA